MSEIAEQTSERQFLENLLNTRVNFVVAVFGLAAAAAAPLDSRVAQLGILAASTVVAGLLAAATSRAQFKLDIMFNELPEDHPARTTDVSAEKAAKSLNALQRLIYGKSRRRLVGYWIPWITTTLLAAGTVGIGVSWYFDKSTTNANLGERLSPLEAQLAGLAADSHRQHEAMLQALRELRSAVDQVSGLVRAPVSVPSKALAPRQ